MKTNLKAMLTVLALGASAFLANAQDNHGGPVGGPGPIGPGGAGGPPMRGHRPPLPAIVRALDANHDGVIDAQEIANAPAALKSLDRNGDGKLTPNEFMGPRPQRLGGPGRGFRGDRGGDDRRLPPGPPRGDNNDNTPAGPPPGGE